MRLRTLIGFGIIYTVLLIVLGTKCLTLVDQPSDLSLMGGFFGIIALVVLGPVGYLVINKIFSKRKKNETQASDVCISGSTSTD